MTKRIDDAIIIVGGTMARKGLLNRINKFIVEKYSKRTHDVSSHTFWPSSASLRIEEKDGTIRLAGKCARYLYWRNTGELPTDKIDAWGVRKMAAGDAIEDTYNVWAEEDGILIEKQHHIQYDIGNITVSGRIDGIYMIDNEIICAEIKTFDGYYAQKEIFGTSSTPGRPKDTNILQVMLYLDYFRNNKYSNEEHNISNVDIKEFRLCYIQRSDMKDREYIISLEELRRPATLIEINKEIHVPSSNICTRQSDVYVTDYIPVITPLIEDTPGSSIYLTGYSLLGLHERMKMIYRCIMSNELPPREYEYTYSDEKIEKLYKDGTLSKKKYAEYQKGMAVGDWNCRWCIYKTKCWGDKPWENQKQEESK